MSAKLTRSFPKFGGREKLQKMSASLVARDTFNVIVRGIFKDNLSHLSRRSSESDIVS